MAHTDLDRVDFAKRDHWKFDPMMNIVHIDEKWFDKQKIARKFILTKGEKRPQRKPQHKSHIKQVMFLCGQARP